jgi:TetR/AcrR family transcriptional regulator
MRSLPSPTSRAQRTRAAILAAAEELFAGRGFEATRLEDVAEAVGIRRASIVYYFRDKADLYDAVLGSVLGDLLARVQAALDAPGPLGPRVEAAVSAWVDCIGARPTLARLLLREVADVGPDRRPALLRHTRPFFEMIGRVVAARRDDPLLADASIDPMLLASAIAGGSVFYLAALPGLLSDAAPAPVSGERLEGLRDAVLRITRRLLGTRGPRAGSGAGTHGRGRGR